MGYYLLIKLMQHKKLLGFKVYFTSIFQKIQTKNVMSRGSKSSSAKQIKDVVKAVAMIVT